MSRRLSAHDPVVITGMGLIASVGNNREAVWRAVRAGQSGVRYLQGLRGIPDNQLIGAVVDLQERFPGRLKVFPLSQQAAAEALQDARIDWKSVDRDRFGCALSAHMGDTRFIDEQHRGQHVDPADPAAWWKQWLPNTACARLAIKYRLGGPRLSYSTACASGLISVLSAVNAIRDGQCDIALAGGGDAIDPLFAAGFQRMGVLARHEDPQQACRPFDRNRNGFVLGEGAAVFVVERLSHALQRGAQIYAEILAGKVLAEAHHVTGLDADSEALAQLISITLQSSRLTPSEIGYVNAHGTGTQQNDLVEMRGIRRGLGAAADRVCVSATKSMLGHMINAAGCVELAITVLALRDGFAPPTRNLTDPDPECTFDCVPIRGRVNRFQHALKISIAFGGHLVAVAIRRWNDPRTGFAYPELVKAA